MGRVRVTGKERFRRQLQRLGPAIVNEVKPVLERNAHELEAAILRDVPRGPDEDLAETVEAYEVKDSNGQAWRVVEGSSRENRGKGFYATFQEFGWLGYPGTPHFFYQVRRLKGRFRARISRAAKKAIVRNFKNGS